MEHLVRGYLGEIGAYALAGSDVIVRAALDKPARPAMRVDDIILLKSFMRSDPPRGSRWRTELWDMYRDIEQVHRTINEFRDQELDDRADALEERYADRLHMRNDLRFGAEQLRRNAADRDEIMRDRTMTKAQKRAALDDLQREANEISEEVARETRAPFRPLIRRTRRQTPPAAASTP